MSALSTQFVDEVEGYTDLNMLDTAADACLRRVEADPTNPDVLAFAVGKVSMGTKAQINQLFPFLESYLATHPDDLKVVEVYAALLSVAKRNAEALAQFARIPFHLRRHDAYWLWFRTLLDAGGFTEARQWIRDTWPAYSERVRTEEFATYIKFLWDISACLFNLGELEEAAAGYQSLLDLDPNALGAYLDYGQLLVRMNRRDEAASVFECGLKLTWKDIDAQCSYPGIMGYCSDERRDYEAKMRAELAKLKPTP